MVRKVLASLIAAVVAPLFYTIIAGLHSLPGGPR
jgi:hypothetical protein